eukprot:gene20040-26020_t
MSKLIVKQAFGLTPNVKNCVTYIDDHSLAYACGHLICIINTDSKEQTFITLGGTAYKSHGSTEYVSISFSDDGKQCLTQGGSPEWNLLLWNVEKSPKVIASIKTTSNDEYPVNQVSFCPWDSTTILVVGKNVMKIFKFTEGQLRFQPINLRRDFINVSAHCWLPTDRLVISTEIGELLLFENLEYRTMIYPTNNDDKHKSISCIISTSRGFLTGGRDGEIQSFERKDETKEYYHRDDVYNLPNNNSNILVMTIGSDDTLVCATESQQLLYISISNLYNLNNQLTIADNKPSNNSKNQHFEYLLTSFHAPSLTGDASITGIDVALWRPLVVTCGKDNSVRLWNPIDKKIELIKYYEEEPTSVSIHPCGLHMSIAFNDKVKLVSILSDDLSAYSEIPVRSCNYTKFSNGGQYLAIIAGPIIQIHDIYTSTLLFTLRGHTNKIRSIVWMNFDTKLMSVGADGVTFFWNLFTLPAKRPEQLNSPIPFLCGNTLLDGSKAYVLTNEKILKEFSFTKTIDPLTGLEGPITAMCLSHDGNVLYTGDQYGCLFESHQLYLKELTEEYEEKLKEEQKLQRKLLEEKELLQVNNDETVNLIEDDADNEINQLRVKYENRLKFEEESSIDLKSQHTILQKNLQLLTKDSDYQKEELKKLRDKETRLQDNIKALEKDIQSHKKEIREREDTITDKEKRIFDLKKKNQELEKFRFVLDYKIKELKLQIAPRENEIITMQKQIEGMNIELEQWFEK